MKKPLSRIELRKLILQLNRMNLSKVPYDYLENIVSSLCTGAAVNVAQALPSHSYFRVRPNPPMRPETWAQLGAPPADRVLGYQRCNPPGVPMFYAASRRIAALLECRVKPGDRVYLSQWMSRRLIPANAVFDANADAPTSGTDFDLVLNFLDTLMTRPIAGPFSDQYKLTSAIAQQLTTKFPADKDLDTGEDGRVALFYPSVLDGETGFNIAMHSSFAQERLDLLHVMELDVVEDQDGLSFIALDNAVPSSNQTLCWANTPHRLPKLREFRDAPFLVLEDGIRRVPTYETPVDDGVLPALLSENFETLSNVKRNNAENGELL